MHALLCSQSFLIRMKIVCQAVTPMVRVCLSLYVEFSHFHHGADCCELVLELQRFALRSSVAWRVCKKHLRQWLDSMQDTVAAFPPLPRNLALKVCFRLLQQLFFV